MTEQDIVARQAEASPAHARLDTLLHVRAWALTGLLVLAILYSLYFAREVVIPVIAALLMQIILAPVVRRLGRLGLPDAVSAALIILSLIAAFAAGIYFLADPLASWIEKMPVIARQLETKIEALKEPVAEVKRATEEVAKIASVEGGAGGSPGVVVVQSASFLERVFGNVSAVVSRLVIIVVLLFFMLGSGDFFKHKIVKIVHRFQDKKRAVMVIGQIESDVSSWFFTVASINVAFGALIGAGLYLIGLPNAALWGIAAAALNFVPFVGPIGGMILVTIVAVISFDTLSQAVMAPAVYAVLHIIEGQFVTPAILGRRLTLNPLMIVVSIVFWAWLWGVPGALLAVPLYVTFKACCDQIDSLRSIGEFLGAANE